MATTKSNSSTAKTDRGLQQKAFFLEVILIFSSTLHLTVYKLREAVPELLCAFLPTTPFPIPPLPTPFGYDP